MLCFKSKYYLLNASWQFPLCHNAIIMLDSMPSKEQKKVIIFYDDETRGLQMLCSETMSTQHIEIKKGLNKIFTYQNVHPLDISTSTDKHTLHSLAQR